MKSPVVSARALLFVTLSGVAVPACQHFETAGTPERAQAINRQTLPLPAGPPASLSRT